MRAALESPEATRGLPHWVDLVFGVDQQSVARRNVLSREYKKDSAADPDVRTTCWKMMGSLPVAVFAKHHPEHDVASTALSLAVNYLSQALSVSQRS